MGLVEEHTTNTIGTIVGDSTPQQRHAAAVACCDRIAREFPSITHNYPHEAKTDAAHLIDIIVGLTPDLREHHQNQPN